MPIIFAYSFTKYVIIHKLGILSGRSDLLMNGETQQTVEYVSAYDPYVYQTLTSVVGEKIIVQVTNNSVVKGVLTKVLPDHIVVEKNETPFFVRTQQIIWVSLGS